MSKVPFAAAVAALGQLQPPSCLAFTWIFWVNLRQRKESLGAVKPLVIEPLDRAAQSSAGP
ncbi:hypothetical protein GC170_21860 [bacterium]|nr:hypothetical protein [bacterium]